MMENGLPLPRRVWAIVSVSAGSVLYTLDAGLANVALPVIADALHVPQSYAVMVVGVYNLVLAMTLMPLAALGERIGHRRMFVLGLALYLLASLLCTQAASLPLLIAARAFQALAAGAVLSVSLAMVRFIYPANHLGRGLGLNTIFSSAGAAIAPALGGMILSLGPWNWVFAVGTPLTIIALACSRNLPEPRPGDGRFDRKGAVLCAIVFGMLISGFQSIAAGLGPSAWAPLIGAGALTAIGFVRHELGAENPVLPVDLLARPDLALSVAAALLAVVASILLMLHIPFRLHELGFAPAQIGAMVAPFALATMLVAPASGMLSDRISPSLLGTFGMGIAVLAVICLTLLPDHPTHFDVSWRMALCGAGFPMFFSPNGRLIVGSVARDRAASASSLLSTTRMFGQALGSTLLGGLLALRLAPAVPTLIAGGLAGLALVLSAARMAVGER